MSRAYRPYFNEETFQSPVAIATSVPSNASSGIGFGSSVRIKPNFDFDYLDDWNQSSAGQLGSTVANFYMKMLVSQPFEVSKFLLQVAGPNASPAHIPANDESDESDEDVDYFVDESGSNTGPRRLRGPRKSRIKDLSNGMQLVRSNNVEVPAYPDAVAVKTPYLWDMICALGDKEGPVGLWRAMNTSCLYQAAFGLLNTWFSNFFAGTVGIPDPQVVDMLQSTEPLATLGVSTAACVVTTIVLVPLALIRARFIVTSLRSGPRSLRSALYNLKQFFGPWNVNVLAGLGAAVTNVVKMATPFVLFKQFGVDEFRSPGAFQAMILGARLLALAVKLPLETFTHRAEVRDLNCNPKTLVVVPIPHASVGATLWHIVTGAAPVSSLYRGWRLEVLGTLSNWGVNVIDAGRQGAAKERF